MLSKNLEQTCKEVGIFVLFLFFVFQPAALACVSDPLPKEKTFGAVLGAAFSYDFSESQEDLLRLAHEGDGNSRVLIAILHANASRSLPAITGDKDITEQLSGLFGRGRLSFNIDEATLYGWMKDMANSGDYRAYYPLYVFYDDGIGVEKDKAESFRWLLKLAEKGECFHEADAALIPMEWLVAEGYSTGKYGAPKDTERGLDFYERAAAHYAAHGDWRRHILLGFGYQHFGQAAQWGFPKDYGKALEHYRLFLNNADPQALEAEGKSIHFFMARIYETGGPGVEKDEDKAFVHMKPAAQAGYPDARAELGRYYRDGIGTEKDPVEAEKWLEMGQE